MLPGTRGLDRHLCVQVRRHAQIDDLDIGQQVLVALVDPQAELFCQFSGSTVGSMGEDTYRISAKGFQAVPGRYVLVAHRSGADDSNSHDDSPEETGPGDEERILQKG